MERKSLKDEFRDFMSETIDKVSKNIFLDDLEKIRDDIGQSSQIIEEKIKDINLSNDTIAEVNKKEDELRSTLEDVLRQVKKAGEKNEELYDNLANQCAVIKAETEEIKEFGTNLLEEQKKILEMLSDQASENSAVVEEIHRQKTNIGWMSVIIFAVVVLMGIIPSDGIILIAVKCVIAAVSAVFAKKVWK